MKLIVTFLSIFISVYIHSQGIHDIIKKEFERVKLVSKPNFPVSLQIQLQGKMAATKDNNKIIFSISEFNKISEGLSETKRKLIIQILLAHEISHLFQFNYYNRGIELNSSPIKRMIIEGQADVLAGYTFGHLLMHDLIHKKIIQNELSVNLVYSIFRKILDIGIEESTIGTHPSKSDRLMSFKSGLDIGMSEYAILEAKQHPKLIMSYYGGHNMYAKVIQQTLFYFDMNPQKENIFQWSYKIARRIINDDPEVLKNLVIIQKGDLSKSIKWNTSSKQPFVNYDFEYLNISNHQLYIEMEVFTSFVHKDKSDNTIYHKKVHPNLYKFLINPKETKKISGFLRWDRPPNDFQGFTNISDNEMPRIVYPGSPLGGYWISASIV